MANLKEVRTRISSTNSTQQITKAMKLVSATKLKRAQDNISEIRPYSNKLEEILGNLGGASADDEKLSAYFTKRKVEKAAVVVVSSDRGLCGAFNSNVFKSVNRLLEMKYKDKADVEVLFVGKKAYDYFKSRTDFKLNTEHMHLLADASAEATFKMGDHLINAFLSETYDEVMVVYNHFINAATQVVKNDRLLPVEMEKFQTKEDNKDNDTDYIFEPGKSEILFELIPRTLKTSYFRMILDSIASEHGSRMVAMDKATENAGEMLKNLKLEYNKARQAAITTEILEIVGGAAALENG